MPIGVAIGAITFTGSVIAFAVVTETIFAWPGMGKLLIDSINQLDRPVIVAYLLVIVTLFIIINFVVDVLYSMLDPRVRLGGGKVLDIERESELGGAIHSKGVMILSSFIASRYARSLPLSLASTTRPPCPPVPARCSTSTRWASTSWTASCWKP